MLQEVDPDENFFNEVFARLDLSNESKYFSINRYNSAFRNSDLHTGILAFNIRSYNKNNGSFIAMLKSLNKPPEIIVLTEMWLTSDEQNICLLDGYDDFQTSGKEWGRISVVC